MTLISVIKYLRHPQYLWAKQIYKILKGKIQDDTLIVDCPCGNGTLSFWLSRWLKNQFVAIDIDESAIAYAKKFIYAQNVQCSVGDINDIPEKYCNQNAVLLCINSLFLLPNAKQLPQKFSKSFKYVICVCPNPNSRNYKKFIRKNPNVNVSEMSHKEIIDIFEQANYKLIHQERAGVLPNWLIPLKDNKIINLFSLFIELILYMSNLASLGEPTYFLYAFSI